MSAKAVQLKYMSIDELASLRVKTLRKLKKLEENVEMDCDKEDCNCDCDCDATFRMSFNAEHRIHDALIEATRKECEAISKEIKRRALAFD